MQVRAELKQKSLERLAQVRVQTLSTTPTPLLAASPAELVYNPTAGPLAGCPQVTLHYSFNRWAHFPPPPPQIMQPHPNPNWTALTAQVLVPATAFCMDAVFSDAEGGVYDNNGGTDFRLAVAGGRGAPPQKTLHVVHIALEMAPVAKVGGLGDVVTSLSRAVQGACLSGLSKHLVLKY